MRSCIRDLPGLLVAQELPPLAGQGDDLDAILAELAEPGDFLALSGGDACPDNERVTSERVRLIHLEAATFRHALVDAAYYVIPFPNCWCWRACPRRWRRTCWRRIGRSWLPPVPKPPLTTGTARPWPVPPQRGSCGRFSVGSRTRKPTQSCVLGFSLP